jgi:hypothetical protein
VKGKYLLRDITVKAGYMAIVGLLLILATTFLPGCQFTGQRARSDAPRYTEKQVEQKARDYFTLQEPNQLPRGVPYYYNAAYQGKSVWLVGLYAYDNRDYSTPVLINEWYFNEVREKFILRE